MNTIPQFPDFVPLALHHKQIIEQITQMFPSYSDFNFVSLFSWDTEASIELSILNNNLVVKFSDYDTGESFLSFIGTHKPLETVDILLIYSKDHALPHELRLVPHSVIAALSDSAHHTFTITENRDNHDYILSVKKLTELAGGEYQRKRKAVNRFTSRHGDVMRHAVLDLTDAAIVKDIQLVMERWRSSRHRDDAEDAKEFVAINRTIQNAHDLGVKGYGVYLDDQLVAFTLFELAPQHDVAVFHFTKADSSIEGIFEFLKHSLAVYLHSLGVEYINIEQDLGIEGLRIAKESYKPVDYLKKYVIAAKE